MSSENRIQVITIDGLEGTIEKQWLAESDTPSEIPLHLQDDSTVMVPADKLERRGRDSYLLKLNLRDLLDDHRSGSDSRNGVTDRTIVVPVVVEEAVVQKDLVETGRVRITRRVLEREEVIEEPLLREEVEVRRVPVHRMVDEAPKPRTEGNVLIVPVLEEVLVVEKRLMLKEELHITHHRREEMMRQQVTLRSQEPVIERFDGDGNPVHTTGTPG